MFFKKKYKTINGETINPELFTFPFDLKGIFLRKEGGNYYLLNQSNTNIALAVLDRLNTAIAAAHKLCPEVSAKKFTEKQFSKQQVKSRYDEYYTLQLSFSKLTNTKKDISKHPVCLSFFPNDQLFAEVFYGQDGSVSKATITVWKNDAYYNLINVISKNDVIEIKSIYHVDYDKKSKIYPI